MAKSKARFLADVLQDDGSSVFVGNFAVPSDFIIDPAGSPTGLSNASLENSSITINTYTTSLGDSVTLVTDDVLEGGSPTNLYFTTQRARDSFSAGTGVTITSGEVAIGQSVGTTDNVIFNQVTATVPYDNSISGLTATNVQSAITELNTLLGGGNVGSQATYNVYEYTTAGNDTQFDLSALSPAGSYIPGYVQVYLNGLLLSESDYTAVDGSTINFSPAITNAGQLLYIIAYDSFNTAEILRVTSIDASASTNSITLDANDDVSLLGSLSFADNEKAIFGAGSDLQIYHDALNSYVQNSTGNLILKNATADYFRGVLSTGAAELYYAGSSTLTTTSTGIDVTGTVTADGLTVDSVSNSEIKIDATASPSISGQFVVDSDRGFEGNILGGITGRWNGTDVVQLRFDAGPDTTNKDDGALKIKTSEGGILSDRVKINYNGDISFYDTAGSNVKFFWDASAESLRIGGNFNNPTSLTPNLMAIDSMLLHGIGSAPGTFYFYRDDVTIVSADTIGTISFTGADGVDKTGATIEVKADANWDATSCPADIVFSTTEASSTAPTERMRINSSGNVGVSTGIINISPNTVKPWVWYHRGIDFGGDATPTYPYGSLSSRVDWTELSNNFYTDASEVSTIANGAASPGLYASRLYLSGGGLAFQRSSNQATSDDTAVSSWITPFTLGSDNNVNFLGSLTLGDTSTGVGNLKLYDTGNNLLQLYGVGANDFLVDLAGTSAIGSLKFNDFYVQIDVNNGTDALTLVSSTTGTAGPQLDFTFEKAVPSNNDVVGRINFNGRDSDLNPTTYARIDGVAGNVVNGAEQGKIIFSVRKNASLFENVVTMNPSGGIDVNRSLTETTARVVPTFMTGSLTLGGGQSYPVGWYRLARSSLQTGSSGNRGSFRISVDSTGGSLGPGQAIITGHKDWSQTARLSSVTSHGTQYFSKFRATMDSNYAYLEGYYNGYTPGSTSSFQVTVHGDTGYYSDYWFAYTENMTAGLSSPVSTSDEILTYSNARAVSVFDLNVSNEIFMAPGAGINFNAVQSSATGTTPSSATLDDYEEGTWTPTVFSGGVGLGTIYYAKYTKIGRVVHLHCYFDMSSTGTATPFVIAGLPFNSATSGYSPNAADFFKVLYSGVYARTESGDDKIYFLYSSQSTTVQRGTLEGDEIGAGYLIFSITYQTT